MVYYPLYRYFILNGEITPNSEFRASENAGGVYEVLRVERGIPLFKEEHLARFFNSAMLAGKTIRFSKQQIAGFLTALIRQNQVQEGNILLSCKTNLKAFFIPHKYPDSKWYEAGVTIGILPAERQNPNAKVFQTSVRQQADKMMEKEGFYEVLLVDHEGRITEGSRSNVFFVENGQLITPPGKKVLLGITRQKTIQLAENIGIPVSEQEVWLNELPLFRAAFITGTSPKVLPAAQIGDCKFDPQNPVVQEMRKNYDKLVLDYIGANS